MTPLPPCDGRCCRNPWNVCHHKHNCAHHQIDDLATAFQAELSAAAEISRYAHLKAGPR